MWLWRGAQSAVFYYLTCTPCATQRDRRQRKKEAARTQRERDRLQKELVTEQPRPFQQPLPFSTNEGWREEIELGPGPSNRKRGIHRVKRVDNFNTVRLTDPTSPGSDGASQNSDDSPVHKRDKGSIGNKLGDWNWKSFQRADEPLWGQEIRGPSGNLSGQGGKDTPISKYCMPVVPPVNDLHPPIACGPTSKYDTRWMLQPPPPAKVMAGKEPMTAAAFPAYTPRGRNSDDDEHDEWDVDAVYGDNTKHRPAKRLSPVPNYKKNVPFGCPIKVPKKSNRSFGTGPPRQKVLTPSQIDYLRRSRSSLYYPPSTVSSPAVNSRYASGVAQNGNDKPVQPSIATVSSYYGDDNEIHLMELEVNRAAWDDVDYGHFDEFHRYRWSCDV